MPCSAQGIYLDIENVEQSELIETINRILFVLAGLMAVSSLFSLYQIIRNDRQLAREIAERKKAQGEMQISEQNLRVVFDNIYDAIFIHDINGKVVQVNQRAKDLYGLPVDHAGFLTIFRPRRSGRRLTPSVEGLLAARHGRKRGHLRMAGAAAGAPRIILRWKWCCVPSFGMENT